MNLPIHKALDTGLVQFNLFCECVKHIVVSECFVFPKHNLWLVWCAGGAHTTHVNLLSRILGTNPRRGKEEKLID